MWVRFTLGRRVIGNATYVPACGTGSTSGSMLNIGHGRTGTLSNNRVAWLLQFSRITVYCCSGSVLRYRWCDYYRIIPQLNMNFFFLFQTNLFTKSFYKTIGYCLPTIRGREEMVDSFDNFFFFYFTLNYSMNSFKFNFNFVFDEIERISGLCWKEKSS